MSRTLVMGFQIWLVCFFLIDSIVVGQHPSESKSNAGSYITPYQSLGNLKPTMGQSNEEYRNSMMQMGQHNNYQPNSFPVMTRGQQPYQAMQFFEAEFNPSMLNGPNSHRSSGHDTKGRKIIGYKTVLEKRKVAVVTMKKQPVVQMKKIITKVPTIRMVSRVVEVPKH
ncbi:Hypothetical predicted protein [Mytilus galloprovincialis]|uniref:Uncharacterized protein n=1 Tax=Mytilus galloprovincialis TaxID=29158 RepID=A0A8B6FAT5_MYTGA|nr:Hypothetical predicted protein [Mytilus galloprovincialis]